MSIQPAIDYIDKDGFRANVGIVLTRGSGEVFFPKGALTAASGSKRRCFASSRRKSVWNARM
jgi:hypothetical protein